MLYEKNEILKILPHRSPILFIDRVLEMETGRSIHAEWDLTDRPGLFDGHFPNQPVLPGNFITEALSQNAGFLLLSSLEQTDTSVLPLLFSIDSMRFLRPVRPEETLTLYSELLSDCGNQLYEFSVKAYVHGKKIAAGRLTLMLKSLPD